MLRALGPGLLLAGAAVGVSHLVQSTRAGAVYGFGLLGVIVLANVLKYPAFRFGPHYAAATGTSLLEGYRRQGRWALALYLVLTLCTMFTVQAAVAFMTAGLAKTVLGLAASPQWIAAGLIAVCAALLGVGRYRWLDRINKAVVVVLTLSTLLSTALLVPQIDWSAARWLPDWGALGLADAVFCAALIGWMPSAVDLSVWHSLWTLAREAESGHRPTLREAMYDFHLGYWGSAGLALCFLLLGAGVMYGASATFAESAGGFAAQVIALYVAALGEWARPVIGVCAFAVMFSTTFTVVDGFPRALTTLAQRWIEPERPWARGSEGHAGRRVYWASLAIIGFGSVALIGLMLRSLQAMVDLATTLSFLTAPALAWLNHRAVHGPEVPPDARPSAALRRFSVVGIVFLSAFAVAYLWVRF